MSGHDIAAKPHQTANEQRPVPGSASMWTYWRCVKPRDVLARERRSEPRSSRFDNLMETK